MFKKEEFNLRSLNSSDKNLIYQWRNKERIRQNMYTDHIITQEEHELWLSGVLEDLSKIYLVCEFKNKPVGLIYFTDINEHHSRCYWGFYLGEDDSPRGCGFVMEYLALEYLFNTHKDTMEIRKLCCEVFGFNTAVIKQHKRFGFKEEGKLRAHFYKNKKYEDVVQMSLFKEDWVALKKAISSKYFNDNNNSTPP
ncbi:hypothetical protein AY600_01070 [Phormidium willei BDU 130791]|nr:hypothetical protein AY600_01070 [Phormidium willei BDU 130791]